MEQWWAAVDSNHLPPRSIGLSAVLASRLDLGSPERHAPSYVVRPVSVIASLLRPHLNAFRIASSPGRATTSRGVGGFFRICRLVPPPQAPQVHRVRLGVQMGCC